MSRSSQIVVFALDRFRYGLPLAAVERVVRVVEVTPLARAPDIVLGAINVQGEVIAVVDIRARFGLPARAMTLSDHLIIGRTPQRRVALIVDAVEGVFHYASDQIQAAASITPGIGYFDGVAKAGADLVLIHDLARLLSLDEDRLLDQAIADA